MRENEIDLSRFAGCDLPEWLLLQIMRVPAFAQRVNEFSGTISIAWIMEEVSVLCDAIHVRPEMSNHMAKATRYWRHSIKNADKWLRRHYDSNGKRIQARGVNS